MSDGFKIEATGADAVILRLQGFGEGARERLMAAITQEGYDFVQSVQDDKLSGQMVGQRTRRLRNSIHFELDEAADSVIGTVGTDVDYALWVHDGTKPHVIEAKNAKALHFFIGSKEFFRRKVNHPGTKARPFLTDTLEERRENIIKLMTAAVMGDAS